MFFHGAGPISYLTGMMQAATYVLVFLCLAGLPAADYLPVSSAPTGSSSVQDSTDVDETAALEALERLYEYIAARSGALKPGWIFGPNVDDAYYYRIRYYHTNEIFTDESESPQRAEALAAGVPLLESVPWPEREVLMSVNYYARRSAIDTIRQFLTLKHFPGGTRMLESSEGIAFLVVYHEVPEQWEPRLRVFRDLLHGPLAPTAIMTSHACYPGLERAAQKRYPAFSPLVSGDTMLPATFSPALLRGLLREEMRYDGLVVSDWVDMGAINRYLIDRDNRLPLTLRKLSTHARVLALCLYAGVDLITGMKNRLLRDVKATTMEKVVGEVAGLADTDSSWRRILRATADRIVRHWSRNSPLIVPDPSRMSLHDCVRLTIGVPIADEKFKALNAYCLEDFQDLWNRQGLLHVMLRTWYIKARYGLSMPDLPFASDNERVLGREVEKKWLMQLQADSAYRKSISTVAWDSPASEKAWRHAFEKWRAKKGI
jgi:beta-glucosidase-like glycosyl hydrolase